LRFWPPSKGTKSTSQHTDVGLVHVYVGIEEGHIIETRRPNSVCELAKFMHIAMFKEDKTIIDVK
ncbi:MAG: hypothetical protein DWC01_05120, partial [Candidatus Poseidoniales archaeon]